MPIAITKKSKSQFDRTGDATVSSKIPYAALTHVCRQIRQEYLAIQRRRVPVVVAWNEVTQYIETFLDEEAGHTLAPRELYISISQIHPELPESCPVVDLLPLVKRAHSPDATVRFLNGVSSYTRDREDVSGQCESLNYLVGRPCPGWRDTVSGSLERIEVHRESYRHGKIRLVFARDQKLPDIRRQLDTFLRYPASEHVIGDCKGEGRFWNAGFHHIVVGIAGDPFVPLTRGDLVDNYH